jgi:hypothetical protein
MNTPISPAVLAFAAELRQWRTDSPAELERMAADIALLLAATPLGPTSANAGGAGIQDAP